MSTRTVSLSEEDIKAIGQAVYDAFISKYKSPGRKPSCWCGKCRNCVQRRSDQRRRERKRAEAEREAAAQAIAKP